MRFCKYIMTMSALATALALTACDGGSGDAHPDIEVTLVSAIQVNGASLTADSTGVLLTFDADPETLTADDITVSGAVKGALTDNGTAKTLAISDITVADGATVTVTVTSPAGYSITGSPKTAAVYKALYIGMPYQGGIIAYIQSGEAHGIIASAADLSVYNSWSVAVTTCNDYSNEDTGTGVYTDWYLPTLDELSQIYINRAAVGGFTDTDYWSSNYREANLACAVNFYDGIPFFIDKLMPYRVRAVRSF
jgi:hypothetical protein